MASGKTLTMQYLTGASSDDPKSRGDDDKKENLEKPLTDSTQDDAELWEAPFDIRNNYRIYQAGFDKQSRPIWVAELGKWNMPKLIDEGGGEIFEKYVIQAIRRTIESVHERNRTSGTSIKGVLAIADFNGFKLSHMTHFSSFRFMINLARKLTKDQELLDCVEIGFIINANGVAYGGLKILKPIAGRFMERMEIFGLNKDKWLPKLLNFCDPTQIPEEYGGLENFKPVKVFY